MNIYLELLPMSFYDAYKTSTSHCERPCYHHAEHCEHSTTVPHYILSWPAVVVVDHFSLFLFLHPAIIICDHLKLTLHPVYETQFILCKE